jgi:hypothetical protein
LFEGHHLHSADLDSFFVSLFNLDKIYYKNLLSMSTNRHRIWEIADLPAMGKDFLGNQKMGYPVICQWPSIPDCRLQNADFKKSRIKHRGSSDQLPATRGQ